MTRDQEGFQGVWPWLTEISATGRSSRDKILANKFMLGAILDYQICAEKAWENARRLAEDILGDPKQLWIAIPYCCRFFAEPCCKSGKVFGHGGFRLVVAHDGKHGFPGAVEESPGAQQEVVAHRSQLGEGPERRALGGGAPGRRTGRHLEFAAEVVGEHGGEREEAVGGFLAAGGAAESALGLELGEGRLLVVRFQNTYFCWLFWWHDGGDILCSSPRRGRQWLRRSARCWSWRTT